MKKYAHGKMHGEMKPIRELTTGKIKLYFTADAIWSFLAIFSIFLGVATTAAANIATVCSAPICSIFF